MKLLNEECSCEAVLKNLVEDASEDIRGRRNGI